MKHRQLVICYKAYNSDTWIDISNYMNEKPSWNEVLGTNLLEFTLSFLDPKDDDGNQIIINAGDSIVVVSSYNFTEIENNSLVGIVIDPKLSVISYDYINDVHRFKFEPIIRQKDFSIDVFSLEYTSVTLLSDILNTIFTEHTDNSLGGYNNFGDLLPKYVLIAQDININGYQNEGTALKHLRDLLEDNNYVFIMKYSLFDDIRIVGQMFIFDKKVGLQPNSLNSWRNGIDNNTIKRGWIYNPYNPKGIDSTEPLTIIADKLLSYSEDSSQIKNYINLIGVTENSRDYTNVLGNTKGVIVEVEKIAQNGANQQDSFVLSFPAKQVLFVSNSLIETDILSSPVSTDDTVYVERVIGELVEYGNVVMLTIQGIRYFRTIYQVNLYPTYASIQFSPSEDGLPVLPNSNDLFQVVGNIDIYLENSRIANVDTNPLNSPSPTNQVFYIPTNIASKPQVVEGANIKITHSTTDYIRTILIKNSNEITLNQSLPFTLSSSDDIQIIGDDYGVSGCVVDTKQTDKATIRFLQESVPNLNNNAIVVYFRLKPYFGTRKFYESISKFGIKDLTQEVKNPITEEQLNQIYLALQQTEPNRTLEFLSYRDDIARVGWSIPINIKNLVQGNFIINQVENKFLGGINKRGNATIEQKITFSQNRESIEDIIKRIEKQNQKIKPTVANSDNVDMFLCEVSFMCQLEEITSNYDLDINSNTRLYLKFIEQSGDVLDHSINYNNDGYLNGGIAWDSYSFFPVGQGSFNFDGSNDYIDCGNDSSLDLTTKITIEGVFRLNSNVGGTGFTIARNNGIISYPPNSNITGWILFLSSNTNISFRLYFDGSTQPSKELILNQNFSSISIDEDIYFQISLDSENNQTSFIVYSLKDKLKLNVSNTLNNSGGYSITDFYNAGGILKFTSNYPPFETPSTQKVGAYQLPLIGGWFDGKISRLAIHSEFRTMNQGFATAKRLGNIS